MTDQFEDERDDVLDEDEREDEEAERAPQPGNTPAPDEPPRSPGTITERDDDPAG